MRLNPRFHSGRYLAFLALAEFQARRYADAIQSIDQFFDRFGSEAPPVAILWALLKDHPLVQEKHIRSFAPKREDHDSGA